MSLRRKRGRPPVDDLLTPAEWRVLWGAQHGLTNPQIADRLGVSVNAVKFHIANVVAKLGLKNKRELRDWCGEPKHSLKAGEKAMIDNISITAIGQIARSVSNIAESEQWYRDVLGLQHLFTFGKLSFFKCGETRLMLTGEQGKAVEESIIYLATDNLKELHQDLCDKGVVFSHAPHKIHQHADGSEEWMAFLKDPDGRPIGLMATYSPQ